MEGIEFELSFGRTMTTILKVAAGIDNLGTKAVGLLAQFQKPVDWAGLGKTQMQLNDFAENMQRSTQAVLGFMQPGIDFEQKMAELQAGTGVTNEELAKMAKSTRALSVEMGIGASETGQVYLDMLSKLTPTLAKTEEGQAALNSMAKTTALLSKGMGGDMKGAGDALTTMLNSYNVDMSNPEMLAKKTAAIGDMLTKSFKEGAIDVGPIAASMKTLGATGALANVSMAESLAFLQVIGQKSAKIGSEGGIAFRNTLMKIDAGDLMPAKTLALLKQGEVNIGLLTDKTKTAADRFAALKPIMKDSALMGELAGSENVVALQGIMNNLDVIKTKTTEHQNSQGEMGRYAEVTMNTTQEAINRLKAGFTELSLTTYDSLKPYVPMISLTSQMAQGVSAVLPLFSFMSTMLTSGVGALFRYVFGLTATTVATEATGVATATTTTAIGFQKNSLVGALGAVLRWAVLKVLKGFLRF